MSLAAMIDNSRSDKNTVHSYLDTYEHILQRFRTSATNILEIGVGENNKICNGGSIKLWLDFFTNAQIHAIELLNKDIYINGWDKHWWNDLLNNVRVQIQFSTDAYNISVIDMYESKNIKFDVIIDDGPHTLKSMKKFIKLYSRLLSENGLMIIEDVQDINWLPILKECTHSNLHKYIKTYDLRHVKNRYDDILFVIDKSL